MADIVLWTLAAFGALGGIVLVYKALTAGVREGRLRLAARGAAHRDFDYRKIEIAMRVLAPGRHYVTHRYATIRSNIRGLRSLQVGISPAHVATYSVALEPQRFSLAEKENPHPSKRWRLFDITFPSPLKKGETAEYHFTTEAVANDRYTIPPFLSWVSQHRVDELVLRVTFSGHAPSHVIYRVMDSEVKVHEEEMTEIDLVNYEARVSVRKPDPRFNYSLQWEYEDNGQ